MIQIEKQLSAHPIPTPVPGEVTLRFDASSTKPDTQASIAYSIGDRWNVCFDAPSGPSRSLPHQATLGPQSSTITKRARLVRCSGDNASLIRVTASVTDVGTGRTRRTACRIVLS